MIEVPAKIWRPKVISRYTCPSTPDDIVDDILDYRQFGKCMYKPIHEWTNDTARTDVIVFNESLHDDELQKDLDFNNSIDTESRLAITNTIKEFWDCFAQEGAIRPILGYEFGIDTDGAKPVCCRKPSYGPYESIIIMEQVTQLKANGWIERCEGPWGSMIVLTQKPHQEKVKNIKDFV